MAGAPDWSERILSEHYSDGSGIDLSWLDKPTRHQFRWRTIKGPWVTSRRRISSGQSLVRDFNGSMPRDIFVSTSSWLDPVNLPRLKDGKKPPPILLDHKVVFDIDMRPFCIRRLEEARVAAMRLREWISEATDLDIQHISFSGGKGFHLIARDPDRSAFSEPDPSKREEMVREQRRTLLDKALDAGHPVDPVVTPDTRRIIRLPGTLHGSTGFACTILEGGLIEKPVKDWIGEVPRHFSAVSIPKRPPIKLPSFRFRMRPRVVLEKRREDGEENLSLEVSSHVKGTSDRSAVIAWLPIRWGEPREAVDRAQDLFDSMDLGPVAYMFDGNEVLAIVPRAIPRDFLLSRLGKAGLRKFEHETRRFDHSWVRISGRMQNGDWLSEIEPITVLGYEASKRCSHPWSAPHLELCKRLGLPIRPMEGEVSGAKEPSIRAAIRR